MVLGQRGERDQQGKSGDQQQQQPEEQQKSTKRSAAVEESEQGQTTTTRQLRKRIASSSGGSDRDRSDDEDDRLDELTVPVKPRTSPSSSSLRRRPASSSPTPTAKNSSASASQLSVSFPPLPSYELYQAQKRARTPFVCPECFEDENDADGDAADRPQERRKFTRSSLATHARSKRHRKQRSLPVDCNVCGGRFDEQEAAFEHFVSSHRLFVCTACGDDFPEFEKLKSHLRAAHRAEWPWICGFCDQPLLYELEFQAHVRQHTDSAPFACPLCKKEFDETSDLTDHLAESHLPRMTKTTSAATIERRTRMKDDGAAKDNASAAAASSRDENAVNREIATLLLNLHSSRSDPLPAPGASATTPAAASSGLPKAEDLSVKSAEKAMDLSAHSATAKQQTVTLNTPLPASITKLVKQQSATNGGGSLDLSAKTSSAPSTSGANVSLPNSPNYSSFYPNLASLSSSLNSSTALAMNSNYLLQNLLLGKMQQIAAASGGDPAAISAAAAALANTATTSTAASSAGSGSSLSFPTQPLPAQALSLPASTGSLKPPPAVLKTAGGATITNGTSQQSTASAASSAFQQLKLTESDTTTNIPLLCGQIVAQLNGLLFLVHGLNNQQVELNLQKQLGAIYTRLQDVVAVVEQAKKQQDTIKDKTLKEQQTKLKEEENIAKQLQDYQRALLQQHQEQAAAAAAAKQVTPLKETAASTDVVTLLKKHAGLTAEEIFNGAAVDQEVQSSSEARRRRGRPPKNSNLDLSYSPPDKRARGSTDDVALIVPATSSLNGSALDMASKVNQVVGSSGANGAAGGGGGKGIRNRVFCGECAGCLKNDDCGRCRYCQDKTKFGGQNRLRQKCLHRRCLMDTQRRRSTNSAAGGAVQSSNANAAAAAAAVAAALATSNAAAVAAAASNGVSITATSFPDMHRGADGAQDGDRSPSPAIYSGVDLARLAAAAASQVEKSKLTQNGENGHSDNDYTAGEKDLPRDSAATIEPAPRRSSRHRQKSAEAQAVATIVPASNGSANSDDDSDDQKSADSGSGIAGGKTQSRIDKWKAKHEAMLKLADGGEGGKQPKQQAEIVGEHVGEVKDEDEDDEDDEVEAVAVTTKSDGKKTASASADDAKEKEMEEDDPEIPNIDGSNGVCIDLDDAVGGAAGSGGGRKKGAAAAAATATKPHTRHSAVQQQALSV